METYIKKYKHDSLEVHFCTFKIDYQFFNFQKNIPNGKTLVLSYNFSKEELSKKIVKSQEQIIEYNENEKEPLKDLHQNITFNAYGFDHLVIEGIDYQYIKDNLHKCLFPWGRKLIYPKVKTYFYIVNIPNGKQQEIEYMIRDYIAIERVCIPIKKKKNPIKNSLEKSVKLLSLTQLFILLDKGKI